MEIIEVAGKSSVEDFHHVQVEIYRDDPHHPPYYRKLFESFGFKIYYEQYSYSMDITSPDLPARFWKIAAWVAKKPEYHFVHFTFREQDRFIHDFIQIHEQAWANSNYKPADCDELGW